MDLKILKIASNTDNNKNIKNHTHYSKLKNPLCGDEIQIKLVIKNDKIIDFGYQGNSCVYCQASASLLSRKIKNISIEEIKIFITQGEKLFDDVKVNIDKHWKDFKEIFIKKNLNRKECLLLPLRTILKAIKK